MEWTEFRERKICIINPVVYYFTLFNKATVGSDYKAIRLVNNGWASDHISKKSFDKIADSLLKQVLEDKGNIKNRLFHSRKIGEN